MKENLTETVQTTVAPTTRSLLVAEADRLGVPLSALLRTVLLEFLADRIDITEAIQEAGHATSANRVQNAAQRLRDAIAERGGSCTRGRLINTLSKSLRPHADEVLTAAVTGGLIRQDGPAYRLP